jgi:molybdate transport system substrate-binding protein
MFVRLVFGTIIVLLVLTGCLGEPTYHLQEDFTDLGKNGTWIAVCDPGHCPAGGYADMVISNVEASDPDLGKRIRDNIVTNDPNVRAVLDKVLTKEVDAGFVYITDASLEMDKLNVIEIPTEFSPLPQYGVTVLRDSSTPEVAELFVDFLISGEGQKTLQEFDFLSALENPLVFEKDYSFSDETLTVYAAASLTDAFKKVAERFETETGVKVEFSFGSSGTLRAKIEGGAPVDVYASASLKDIDILINRGFAVEHEVFARNRLVVVTPAR